MLIKFSALLCLFSFASVMLQAQKKPSFERNFVEAKALAKMSLQQKQLAQHCGFFSKTESGESMFNQAMELVRLPIWLDRWTEDQGWLYFTRYYTARVDRPIVQYVVYFKIQGDTLHMRQHRLKPEIAVAYRRHWWQEQRFNQLSEEDFELVDCQVWGLWKNQAWHFDVLDSCILNTPLGRLSADYKSVFADDKLQIATIIHDEQEKLIYQDQDPQVFRRLSRKEIKTKIEEYEKQ